MKQLILCNVSGAKCILNKNCDKMKRIIFISLFLFGGITTLPAQERQCKWNIGTEISASLVPCFAGIGNSHNQQLQFGITAGRTIVPWFYLGVGTEYVLFTKQADCLPVYLNPRFYTSRNASSFFFDLRPGCVVWGPIKKKDGDQIRAKTGLFADKLAKTGIPILSYLDVSLGWQFKEHLSVSIYGNRYKAIQESRKEIDGGGVNMLSIGFRIGYQW